jgi:hypothetical protein
VDNRGFFLTWQAIADTNCKDHHSMHANYERIPEEEKRLQKERERQQAKQEEFLFSRTSLACHDKRYRIGNPVDIAPVG